MQRRNGSELRPVNFVRPLQPHPSIPGALAVPLPRGLFAIVDEADGAAVGQFNWRPRKPTPRTTTYAITGRAAKGNGYTMLHQFLWSHWGLPDAPEIDHKNANGLDCRRENLRAASHAENQQNVPMRATNTSGFKGVSFHRLTGKWQAEIQAFGRRRNIGLFESAAEAASAYTAAARELHGEFARTT
jgi:hypothetical protein